MGFLPRNAKRFLPRHSVTVAILEDNFPIAYGVVQDISERGICVVTNSRLSRDREFTLKMSFYREGMVAAGGRIVWSETSIQEPADDKGRRHGVQFTKFNERERRELHKILFSSSFAAELQE
jgi:hypothetical protein